MSKFSNLIKSVQLRKKEVELTLNGWRAYICFDISSLENDEKELLAESLSGKIEDNAFKSYISDNSEAPLVFLEEKYAFLQLADYDKTIEKKIEFHFVINKGISLQIPKVVESPIKWVN